MKKKKQLNKKVRIYSKNNLDDGESKNSQDNSNEWYLGSKLVFFRIV